MDQCMSINPVEVLLLRVYDHFPPRQREVATRLSFVPTWSISWSFFIFAGMIGPHEFHDGGPESKLSRSRNWRSCLLYYRRR